MLKELRNVFELVLYRGKECMGMVDVRFVAMDVDGASLERSSDAGADDVDDAGFGDDRVAWAESAFWVVAPKEGASLAMARFEQKGSVHRTCCDLVDGTWFEPSYPRTQAERTFRN